MAIVLLLYVKEFYWRKRFAMDFADSVLSQGFLMFGRAIAFVFGEVIRRIELVLLVHVAIASDFSENRRGSDTAQFTIALHHAFVR